MLLLSPHDVRRTAWLNIATTLFVSPCCLSAVTTCTRQIGEQRWKVECTARRSVREATPGGGHHIAQGVDEVVSSDGTREKVSHSGLNKAWCKGRQVFPDPQVVPQAPGAGSGRSSEVERSAHPSTSKPSGGEVNDLQFDNDQDDRGAEDSAAAGGETPS